jgi:hypothetical protein
MNKGSKYKSGQRPTFRIWDNENDDWYQPTYEAFRGKVEDILLSQSGDLNMRTLTEFAHESLFPERFEVVVDEPQKVKVPTFVAEYFNYCIANERTLAEALSGLDRDFKIPDYLYPAIKWLEDSINQNIFAQAWLYGYEVEEEPKWVVKRGLFYFEEFDSQMNGDKFGFNGDQRLAEAHHFSDKSKAEAVADLIGGEVKKV